MNKTQIAAGVAAAIGLTSAQAVVVEVSIVGTVSESNMGPSTAIISESTATWSYDTDTDILTASGLYKEQTQITPEPGQLFTHNVVDMVVGNSAPAAATSYSCVEGSFGGTVGASLCGNYNFGTDFANDSTATWGPGTLFGKTLGGDDGDIGVQQNLTQYDGMSTTNVCDDPCAADGRAWDGTTLVMSNAISADSGYAITLRLADWAIDDGPVYVLPNDSQNIDVLNNDLPFDANISDLFVASQPTTGTATVLKDDGVNPPVVCEPEETNPGPPPEFGPDPDCFPTTEDQLSIQFAAPPGFSGTETFTYEVNDIVDGTDGASDTAVVTVIADLLPNAVDDSPTVAPGSSTPINVLGNDDLGNAPNSTVNVISGPTSGTITTTLPVTCATPIDCALTYDAAGGGSDSFVYELTDDNNDTSQATVNITIGTALVAIDDDAATDLGFSVDINVLGNDVNLGDPNYTVDVSVAPGPGEGTVDNAPQTCTSTIPPAANGLECALQYTPPASPGDYSFEYSVVTATAGTDTATVNVFVNDLPVPADDETGDAVGSPDLPPEAITAMLTPLDVQANDTGLNDTPITVTITTPATNGTAVFNAGTGNVDYTSDPGFVGQDTFAYELTDNRGIAGPDTSTTTAMVTVNVDDKPEANDDGTMGAPGFQVEEGTTSTPNLDILANDTGLSDTPLTVTITTPPAFGMATVIDSGGSDAASIRVQYDANSGAGLETDSFVYEIVDNSGDTSSATAWVAVTDADFPMAMDDAAATDTNQPVDTNVLANDAGLVDEPLVVTITTPPGNGMTAQAGCDTQATCVVTYTPNGGFAGTDTYQYTVSDVDGDTSNVATVTITVNPIAVDDEDFTFVDTAKVTNVLKNDQDLNEPLTVTITTGPANGSAAAAGCDTQATCEVTYTPNAGFIGTDTYQYSFTDNFGSNSNIATVTMAVNEVPLAVDDTANATGTEPAEIDVLDNDTGLSAEPVTVTISQQGATGTATVNGSPGNVDEVTVWYRSNEELETTDQFEYTVTDNFGNSSSAMVTMTVTGSGGPIPPQESVPGSSSSLAFGPISLLSMSLIPLLRRLRRRR